MITLKTLPEATEQEVFEQIVSGLLKQNKQSTDDIGECQYRNDEGLRCAAGMLISDAEYSSSMEGLLWTDLVDRGDITATHKELIRDCQLIHDDGYPELWKESFTNLGKAFKLDVTFMEKL